MMIEGNGQNPLYTLIPLDDFKAILGIDDREDKTARFCLVTSTFTIEQYCRRRLLRNKHFEKIEYTGDLFLPLREYPIVSVNSVEIPHPCRISTWSFYDVKTPAKAKKTAASREEPSPQCGSVEYTMPPNSGEILAPRFYRVFPDFGTDIDLPFSIVLSPIVKKIRGLKFINVCYSAGYRVGKVPADLASACLELAAWNMNRYKGRRIGMSGNIRGNGRDGEHFEMSMPENVRGLLEPYRRKVI